MNIVRNKLFEIKRGNTSGIESIGIGRSFLIKKWLKEVGINNYSINDWKIDVNGNVTLMESALDAGNYDPELEHFPDYIQFGTVYGDFDISGMGLLHLRGCPIKVTKTFNCSNNKLTSLSFCPKFVYGNFVCFENDVEFSRFEINNMCKVGKQIVTSSEEWGDFLSSRY